MCQSPFWNARKRNTGPYSTMSWVQCKLGQTDLVVVGALAQEFHGDKVRLHAPCEIGATVLVWTQLFCADLLPKLMNSVVFLYCLSLSTFGLDKSTFCQSNLESNTLLYIYPFLYLQC